MNLTEAITRDKVLFIQEAMPLEETLIFFDSCAPVNKDTNKKDTTTQELFLEYMCKSPQTPDNLFTRLAEMYIEKLLALE